MKMLCYGARDFENVGTEYNCNFLNVSEEEIEEAIQKGIGTKKNKTKKKNGFKNIK